MRRPLLLAGLLAVALVVVLSLWTAQRSADVELELPELDRSRARPQGGWWVGATSEPPHLNVLTTTDAVARHLVLRYTHDTLARYDAASQLMVGTLADLTQDGDPAALRVHLHDAAEFSDGTPVTAADLEFVFRASRAPDSQFGSVRGVCEMIKSVVNLGPKECLFTFVNPASARALLNYPVVQARHYRDAVAELARSRGRQVPTEDSAEFSALLAQVRLPGPGTAAYSLAREVGTGAVAWRAGSHLFMVQNPRSWRRHAQPESWNLLGIGLRFLSDPAAQVTALRQGGLDWYSGDDAPQLLRDDPAIARRMRLLEYDADHLGHHMVIWNTRRKPLDDPRVRRALSKLFDRRAIVDRLMFGHGRPASAWGRPAEPYYPADLAPVAFDPQAARSELREAGVVVDGAPAPRLVALVGTQLSLHRRILEQALPAFTAAGIELVIEPREWAEITRRCDSRDFDVVLMNWSHSGLGAPVPWILHSRYLASPGRNYPGLASPELDALLDEMQNEAVGRDDLIQLHHRLARLLRELEPVSLLAHPKAVLLIDKRFQGVEPGPGGVTMEKFWVPQETR